MRKKLLYIVIFILWLLGVTAQLENSWNDYVKHAELDRRVKALEDRSK